MVRKENWDQTRRRQVNFCSYLKLIFQIYCFSLQTEPSLTWESQEENSRLATLDKRSPPESPPRVAPLSPGPDTTSRLIKRVTEDMPTADGECSMLAEEQGWRHFWNLDTWPFSLKQKSAGTDPRQSRGGETAGSFRLFPDECFCNMFASHSWFKQHDLCWVYKATPTKTHSALKHGWRSNDKIHSLGQMWDVRGVAPISLNCRENCCEMAEYLQHATPWRSSNLHPHGKNKHEDKISLFETNPLMIVQILYNNDRFFYVMPKLEG